MEFLKLGILEFFNMKIAIDANPLKSTHQYRGIGFYTKNLIEALKKYKPGNEYIFFTRTVDLPKNVDLVHYPYFDIFDCSLPLFKKLPIVVTIHDLTPLVFPDKFPRGIKGEIKWQWQKLSLKSVSAIITDSKNSREDITRLTHFSKEKVHVIPLAPGEEFQQLTINNKQLTKTRRKYNLPEHFVLYVGDVNWNKNVMGMLKAFQKTKNQKPKTKNTNRKLINKKLKLVLVGKAFKDETLKETQEINQLIDELGITNSVLKLGFVPTEDLVVIYNLASVYCQPSFYEGFGLPCLEAMACGTPVIAANITALKEVCGKAAIYVNPYKPDEIASGTLKVLKLSDSNYQALVEKSLEQAKKFGWKKVAKETVEVYEGVRSESVNQEK